MVSQSLRKWTSSGKNFAVEERSKSFPSIYPIIQAAPQLGKGILSLCWSPCPPSSLWKDLASYECHFFLPAEEKATLDLWVVRIYQTSVHTWGLGEINLSKVYKQWRSSLFVSYLLWKVVSGDLRYTLLTFSLKVTSEYFFFTLNSRRVQMLVSLVALHTKW